MRSKMQKKFLTIMISLLMLGSMLLGGCAPAAATAEPEQPAEVEEPEAEVATQPPEPTEAPPVEAPTEPPAEAPPESVVITDSSGNVVELDQLPQRVVVAGKATPFTLSTTYLFEEAIDRVVAQELRGLTIPEFLSLIDPKYEDKNGIKRRTDCPGETRYRDHKEFCPKGIARTPGETGYPGSRFEHGEPGGILQGY
jgi:ABC-type Fe3+-hydroxamate transport system substrate-binding protein